MSINEELFYEVLTDELYERNWGYTELAHYSGCDMQALFQLRNKKRILTNDLAEGLAKAFGTSAELWMNLYNDTTNIPATGYLPSDEDIHGMADAQDMADLDNEE